ncbi:hypothetical protein BDC45DRAFT_602068 [Circinella umbellata]|nr:hypothetical protein BDC45DRAFT_602068 [Circinella umbellata]
MDFIRKKASNAFTHPPDDPGMKFGPTDIQQQQGGVLEQSAIDLEEDDQHPCEVEPQVAKPQRAVVGQESTAPPIHQEPIKERDTNTNQRSDFSNTQDDMVRRRDVKPETTTTTTGAPGTAGAPGALDNTGASGALGPSNFTDTTGATGTTKAGTGAAGVGAGAGVGAAAGAATGAAPGAGVSGTHTPVWAYVPTKTVPPANPEIMSKKPTAHNQQVVDSARSLPSIHQMPPLPAAGCFDLDAPGNAPIITGYNHDHRSVTSKVAQNVSDAYEKNQALKRSQMYSTTDKTPTTGSGEHTGAKTAAGIAGGVAVGGAAAGGIMAKCMDYLRGRESKDTSQNWDEPLGSSQEDIEDKEQKTTAASMSQSRTSQQEEQGREKLRDEDWETQDNSTKLNYLGEEGHYNTSGEQVLHEPKGGEAAPSIDLTSNRAVIDDDVDKLQPTSTGGIIDHSQDISNGKTPNSFYSYVRVDDNKTPSSCYGRSIDQRGASHENPTSSAGIGAGVGAGVGAATGGGIAAATSAHRRKNKQENDDTFDQSAKKSTVLDEPYGTTSAIDPSAQLGRQPRSSIDDDMTMHDDSGMRSNIKGSSDPYNTRSFGHTERDQPRSAFDAVQQNDPSSMGAWDEIDDQNDVPSKTTTATGSVSKNNKNPFVQDQTSKTSTKHDQQKPARPSEFLFDDSHSHDNSKATTTATSGVAGAGIGASVGAASAAGIDKHKQREQGFHDVDQAIDNDEDDQHPIDDNEGASNLKQEKPWEEPSTHTGQRQSEKFDVIEDVENGGLRKISDQQKDGIVEPRPTPRDSTSARDKGAGGATAAAAAAALEKEDKLKSQREEPHTSSTGQQPDDQIKQQQYRGPGGITDQQPVTDRIQPDDQQHIAEGFEDQQQRQSDQLQDDITKRHEYDNTDQQPSQQRGQQQDSSKKSIGTGAAAGAAAGAFTGIASSAGVGNKKIPSGQARDMDQQSGQYQQQNLDQLGQKANQRYDQQDVEPLGEQQSDQQDINQPSQQFAQQDMKQAGQQDIIRESDQQQFDQGEQRPRVSQQQQQQSFSSDQNFKPSREGMGDKAFGQQHHGDQPQPHQQSLSSDQNFEEMSDRTFGQQHYGEQQPQPVQQQQSVQQQQGVNKKLPAEPQEESGNAGGDHSKFDSKDTIAGQAKQQISNMMHPQNMIPDNMKQQATSHGGSSGGITGALGAGAGAVTGGLGAAIGAAKRRTSKTKPVENPEEQGIPKTLDGAVGGVDDDAVGNLTSRRESQSSKPRKASEQSRSASMGGNASGPSNVSGDNAAFASGGAGGADAAGAANQQEPIPASQIIQQGGVIYHDQPPPEQRNSLGGSGNKYKEASTTRMNKSTGSDTGPSTYQSGGSSQAPQDDKMSPSQSAETQEPVGHQQPGQSMGQQQYQPMGQEKYQPMGQQQYQPMGQQQYQPMGQQQHQPMSQQPYQPMDQQQYQPMGQQAGDSSMQQQPQHFQQQEQQPMNNSGGAQGGAFPEDAADNSRRVSFQDYVSGKIDRRRGSFKENMGKIFHKNSWKQGGQEQKTEAEQTIEGYERVRRQSKEGAAM